MSVIEIETSADEVRAAEVRAHQRTFIAFERLVFFGAMHVALVLICLALAFLGHIPVIALFLGIAGTVALISIVSIAGSQSTL